MSRPRGRLILASTGEVYMSERGYIYAIGAVGTPYVKIGRTGTSPATRLKELQTGHHSLLHILASVPVQAGIDHIEKALHQILAAHRQHGEWFVLEVDQAHLEALVVQATQSIVGTPDSIGKRLKALREKRGLTIRALATKAGVPQSTLSMFEQGVRPGAGLRLETAKRICWALGVGIGELAGSITDDRRGQEDSELLPTAVALAGV
jgi:DNA-binding Xre family transcriptional regulator